MKEHTHIVVELVETSHAYANKTGKHAYNDTLMRLPNRIARIYAHALAQPNRLSILSENALFFNRFEKSTKKVMVRILLQFKLIINTSPKYLC
jgi:hypothetical protein